MKLNLLLFQSLPLGHWLKLSEKPLNRIQQLYLKLLVDLVFPHFLYAVL